MPKKDGVTKTYSFSRNTIAMLEELCKYEYRTQTNLIEMLILKEYIETSRDRERKRDA